MTIEIINEDRILYLSINWDIPERIIYFSLLPNELIYSKTKEEKIIIDLNRVSELMVFWKLNNKNEGNNEYYLKNRDRILLARKIRWRKDVAEDKERKKRLYKV